MRWAEGPCIDCCAGTRAARRKERCLQRLCPPGWQTLSSIGTFQNSSKFLSICCLIRRRESNASKSRPPHENFLSNQVTGLDFFFLSFQGPFDCQRLYPDPQSDRARLREGSGRAGHQHLFVSGRREQREQQRRRWSVHSRRIRRYTDGTSLFDECRRFRYAEQ